MTDKTQESGTESPRVAVIGGGVMGGTIITAVRVAGWPADGITVAEKDPDRAAALRETHGIEATSSIADAVEGAEVIVVAVKPQDTQAALTEIATSYKPGAIVLTVVAGLTAEFYEKHLPEGSPVVRCMPNTPAIVARGATAIAAGNYATAQHLGVAEAMLRATGMVAVVTEDQLDAVTAVSGSGPAYFYAMVEALTEAGVAQGLEREMSMRLAAQTFIGAAQLLMESGDTPQKLRRRVSSPGGTTIAALEAMEAAGLQGVVTAGANAAAVRSKELREELGS